eukprot:scaffold7869_cov138-Cylindrotheca_fusiformis.AAC.1
MQPTDERPAQANRLQSCLLTKVIASLSFANSAHRRSRGLLPLTSVVRSGRPPGESTQSTRHGRSPCADRVRAEKRQRRRRSSGGCA